MGSSTAPGLGRQGISEKRKLAKVAVLETLHAWHRYESYRASVSRRPRALLTDLHGTRQKRGERAKQKLCLSPSEQVKIPSQTFSHERISAHMVSTSKTPDPLNVSFFDVRTDPGLATLRSAFQTRACVGRRGSFRLSAYRCHPVSRGAPHPGKLHRRDKHGWTDRRRLRHRSRCR